MNVRGLIEKRELRRIPIDEDKVSKSLQIAKKFLEEAEVLKKENHAKFVIMAAYTSMFHGARALLYKNGLQEKSHYAVYIYLKEKYGGELNDLVFEFDAARDQRHTGLYGLDYEFDEEDCTHIISVAHRFYKKCEELLE